MTVTLAITTGSDGVPEVRSTAVGVSIDSTGTPSRRAGGTLDGLGDGVAQRAPDATPEQAIDDERRALDAVEQQRDIVGRRGVHALDLLVALEAIPVGCRIGRGGPLGAADEHCIHALAGDGQVTRRDERIATVVARSSKRQDEPRRGSLDRVERRSRGRGNGGAGLLHQLAAGHPHPLGAAVGAAHLLAVHRPPRRIGRPVQGEHVEIEVGRGQRGITRRQLLIKGAH